MLDSYPPKKPWLRRPTGIASFSIGGLLILLFGIALFNMARNPSVQEMRAGSIQWANSPPEERLEMFFAAHETAWSPIWEITGVNRDTLTSWLGEPTSSPSQLELQYVRNHPSEAGSPRPSNVIFVLGEDGKVHSVSRQRYQQKPAP